MKLQSKYQYSLGYILAICENISMSHKEKSSYLFVIRNLSFIIVHRIDLIKMFTSFISTEQLLPSADEIMDKKDTTRYIDIRERADSIVSISYILINSRDKQYLITDNKIENSKMSFNMLNL